jgi:hypothetical protein
MGFINHCEPELSTSKPPTPEPEVSRHTTVETEVVFDTPTSAAEKTPTSEVHTATTYEALDTPRYKAENTSTYEFENTPTYEILDTPTYEAESNLNYEVESTSTCEIFHTTTSEVLDTPNDEAENTSTYGVKNTPTYEVDNTPTCEIVDTTTSEVLATTIYEVEKAPTYEALDTPNHQTENTLTHEVENAPTYEDENTPTCEDLASPIDETANTEPSLETSEQITNEHHITQQEDNVLPISTCTTCLTYPKYYETSIYDSISTERLPPIMEDIVYECHPDYHKTTEHLSIESFITTQQENPEVALDSAPGTSEMTTSEPEITECTTPDSLGLELEHTSPNPSNLILSEPMATGLKKPTICFDPNGDLILTIGSGPGRDMLVDSRALSRASPKLHAILSRDGKKNDDSWTFKLPEDDPLPFAILLNLIHTRFERIPARVTLKQLYGICILTQKYNMTEVLRPVAERWYKNIGRPSEGEYGLFFKRAFVTWELGFAEDLSEMAGHVVLNCYLDEDDQLVIGKEKEKLSDFSDFQRIPLLSQSYHIYLRRILLTCLRMY